MSGPGKLPPLIEPKDVPTLLPHDVAPATLALNKRRQTINSFKALMRHRYPARCEWSVYAWFLVDPPAGKTLDPSKEEIGMYIPLGSYPCPEDAKKVVDHLIETTGHPLICARKTCTWGSLTTKVDPKAEFVPVDLDGKLIKAHAKVQREEVERLERKREIEEEVIQEKDRENDPNSLDHYIHNWFVAIKNRATYHVNQKAADTAKENYEKRSNAIREQYARQPHFEKEWLPELQRRLHKRGEDATYEAIVRAVEEMKSEVLSVSVAPVTTDASDTTTFPVIEDVIGGPVSTDASRPSFDNTSVDPLTPKTIVATAITQGPNNLDGQLDVVVEQQPPQVKGTSPADEEPLDELQAGSLVSTVAAPGRPSATLVPEEPLDELQETSKAVTTSPKVVTASPVGTPSSLPPTTESEFMEELVEEKPSLPKPSPPKAKPEPEPIEALNMDNLTKTQRKKLRRKAAAAQVE